MINPRYQFPCKDYFSRTVITELHERTQEQMAAKVKKNHTTFQPQLTYGHRVAISVPYLCLTIHYQMIQSGIYKAVAFRKISLKITLVNI